MAVMPPRCMRASTAADVATMPKLLQAPHWMLWTGRPAAATSACVKDFSCYVVQSKEMLALSWCWTLRGG